LGRSFPTPRGRYVPVLTSSPLENEIACEDIYETVCEETEWPLRDPTGRVRRDVDAEVEVLRMFEELLLENPEWSREEAYEELVRVVYSEKRVKRLRAAFQRAREEMERFIQAQPPSTFSAPEKRALIKTIRSVQLQLPPPAKLYSDELDLFTKNGVYYQRMKSGRLRLRVGGAFLFAVSSWFNLIFTFSHELAHSFDPCELREHHRRSHPAIERLSACLQKSGVVALTRDRQECGDDDHLSEAFADWMAVQVTARVLERYATEFDAEQLRKAVQNSVRDLCEQKEDFLDVDLTYHPAPEIRIERIFGTHPTVRRLLGCGPAPNDLPSHCGFDWVPSVE
jgi:hypothetical protein